MQSIEASYLRVYGQQETQQTNFLSTYPEYDGRQVIIAIIDSGIDPAFPGLQLTTTGQRKLIDCIDCTGSGDVDTSTIRTVSNDVIEGLTGRKLKIPKTWNNPTGEYHLGIKPIYELYTTEMKKEVQLKQRKTRFSPFFQESMKKLDELILNDVSCAEEATVMVDQTGKEEDILCKQRFLKKMSTVEDLGPVADCIVWHDGTHWRACMDTTYCGRLDECIVMSSFKEKGEYAKVSTHDDLTYSFRISENGMWLQVVVSDTVHGSIVAAAASGHNPCKPELNGIAPGAKVLSLKVYDTRTSSYSHGAFMNALGFCDEFNVDIITVSTGNGESTNYTSFHLAELTKFIRQRNILCFACGGNGGPALFTSEVPAAADGVIGVAAHCPAEFRSTSNKSLLTFSSSGPCLDGYLGISVCAPGLADHFDGVNVLRQMGTILSAPFAAGLAGCLLSALKLKSQTWTTYGIQLAFENTATLIKGVSVWRQGQGLMQLMNAYECVMQFPVLKYSYISISVDDDKRGILLKDSYHFTNSLPQTHKVAIIPHFAESIDSEARENFVKRLSVICDEQWVNIGENKSITPEGYDILLNLDYNHFEKGQNYFTQVLIIDDDIPTMGPIARISISIIVPETIIEEELPYELSISPGQVIRKFIHTPSYANLIEVNFANSAKETVRPKLEAQINSKVGEFSKSFYYGAQALDPTQNSWKIWGRIEGESTVEVSISRCCTDPGKKIKLQMQITFHRLEVDQQEVNMLHSSGSHAITIRQKSPRPIEIMPNVNFVSMQCFINPCSSIIKEDIPIDRTPVDRKPIYELSLTYKLSVLKTCWVNFGHWSIILEGNDSPFWGFQRMIFTENNQLVESVKGAGSLDYLLLAGTYIFQERFCHINTEVLKKMKSSSLMVMVYLKPIELVVLIRRQIHDSTSNAESAIFKTKVLHPNVPETIFISSIEDSRIPNNLPMKITAGMALVGRFNLYSGKDEYLNQYYNLMAFYRFVSDVATDESSTNEEINDLTTNEDEEKEKQKTTVLSQINALSSSIRKYLENAEVFVPTTYKIELNTTVTDNLLTLDSITKEYHRIHELLGSNASECFEFLDLSVLFSFARLEYGKALQFLTEKIAKLEKNGKGTNSDETSLAEICSFLGWSNLGSLIFNNMLVRRPSLPRPFSGQIL